MQCVHNYIYIYVCIYISKCWKEACLYIYTTVLYYIYILSPSVVVTSHFASKVLRPQLPLACYRSISLGRWFPPTPNHRLSFHQGSCWCWSNLSAKECQEIDSINVQRKTKPDESDKDWWKSERKLMKTVRFWLWIHHKSHKSLRVAPPHSSTASFGVGGQVVAFGCLKMGNTSKWIKMALYHTVNVKLWNHV